VHPSFQIHNRSFTEKSFVDFIEELLVSNEIYLQDIGVFLKEWTNDKDYVCVNTSGSTGTPKEIKLLKKHMKNSALATGEYFKLKENSTALLCLSANYIAGKMMLVRALTSGWNIYLKPPSSTPLKDNVTYDFAAMVPLQVASSLNKLHNVKQLIIGGAPVSISLQDQLQRLSTACYVTYGMTETCTHIAVKNLGEIGNEIYNVLPNITIAQDKRECLVISAPNITKEKIITNDIVNLISKTEFQWLGRYDSIINSGGVKLFPEQIEMKLSTLITTRFFVAGIPDTTLGEQLILVVERNSELKLDNNLLSKLLLKYEIPKKIVTLKNFKETPTGKIHRSNTLKALFG
jgi:O-succinylbenzoic acid--CoA ligase